MNNKISALSILLLALVLLPISLAQETAVTANAPSEDFTAAAKALITQDVCTTAKNIIKITNTGTQTNNYLMKAEGDAAEWIKYPSLFTLAPKQSTNVETVLNIPCIVEAGNYQLLTVISTTTGIEKEIVQDLTVVQTQPVILTVKEAAQKIKPCQTAKYLLNLSNPAKFAESYTFSIDNTNAKISEQKTTLNAGESKQIIVSIETKDCTYTGKQDMIFSVQTEKTQLIAELDLSLEIENTYIPVIADGISKIKTDYNKNSVDIEILNTGINTTDYIITASGIDWIAVTPRLVTVASQEKETITLYLEPTEEVKTGSYTAKITAETEDGASYEKELTIKLKKQGLIDNLFDKYLPLTILIIIAIIVFGIVLVYTIKYTSSEEYQKWKVQRLKEKEKLRAKRLKEKEAWAKEKERLRKEEEKLKEAARKEKERLETEKLKNAEDRKKQLELEKQRKQKEQEKLERKFAKKNEKELRKEYVFVSKKDIISGKKQGGILRKIMIVFALLILLSLAIIFNKPIINNITYVLAGIAILVVLYLIVRIRRLRNVTATWRGITLANEMKLFDIAWKNGLQQIKFKLNTPIKNLLMWAKKGRGRNERYICIDEHIYQYFRLGANTESNDFEETEATFKVSKKWLARKNIDADEVKLYYLTDGEWKEQETEKTDSDAKYVYYTAQALLGQNAIIGTEKVEEIEEDIPKSRILPLIVVLLISAVILLLINPSLITPVTPGIPMQKWTSGNEQTVDLNKYFIDPDGDTLDFGVKEDVEGINAEIIDGVAYLNAERDFTGTKTIVFTATDNKGGIAESNNVKLIVQTRMQGLLNTLLILLKYALCLIIIITGIIFVVKVLLFLKRSVTAE